MGFFVKKESNVFGLESLHSSDIRYNLSGKVRLEKRINSVRLRLQALPVVVGQRDWADFRVGGLVFSRLTGHSESLA